MSTLWLFTDYPPSRWVIEQDLREKFWFAGFKSMWISCLKNTPPFECVAEWRGVEFSFEWEPKNYLLLKMKTPNQDLLDAFEKMLKHNALAAYKKDNTVLVEWRVTNAEARLQELQASGVAEFERLDK